MKILIYSANFSPEQTGIGKYSGEMAMWLANQGHEVRVIAAPPHYPDWKIKREYVLRPFATERLNGFIIYRAPLILFGKPRGAARALSMLSFSLLSIPQLLRQVAWRPDLVFTVAPYISCAPGGHFFAKLVRARSWLHVQDFEVDIAFGMGQLKGERLKLFFKRIETAVFRRFDRVSTISSTMLYRLHSKGVDASKTVLLPNWADTDSIRPLNRHSCFRDDLSISPEAKVFLFSGTLGEKQGLDIIPATAEILSHRKDFIFVICGDGVMKPFLEAKARLQRNIRLLPLQPVNKLGELLGMADIHLLPQSGSAEDLVLPSKITGMLSSGRPIAAACSPSSEIAKVISGCGLISPPGDAQAMANNLIRIADDHNLCREFGNNARIYAERHISISSVLTSFVEEASRLVMSPRESLVE